MMYRTKTYIAGDWTGDQDAVKQLQKWNESNYWGLSFNSAHDITQSRDESLNCSIKNSLAKRMDSSKTFVLIVGDGTISRRAGECNYCQHQLKGYYATVCLKGGSISNKSFIEYECDKANRDGLKIVVLYNSTRIDRSKCPEVLRNKGTHAKMKYYEKGSCDWDYQEVKKALS